MKGIVSDLFDFVYYLTAGIGNDVLWKYRNFRERKTKYNELIEYVLHEVHDVEIHSMAFPFDVIVHWRLFD